MKARRPALPSLRATPSGCGGTASTSPGRRDVRRQPVDRRSRCWGESRRRSRRSPPATPGRCERGRPPPPWRASRKIDGAVTALYASERLSGSMPSRGTLIDGHIADAPGVLTGRDWPCRQESGATRAPARALARRRICLGCFSHYTAYVGSRYLDRRPLVNVSLGCRSSAPRPIAFDPPRPGGQQDHPGPLSQPGLNARQPGQLTGRTARAGWLGRSCRCRPAIPPVTARSCLIEAPGNTRTGHA